MDGLVLLLFVLLSGALMVEAVAAPTSDDTSFHPPSNCSTSCGSIRVPYPFGIAPDCARPGFNLTCNQDAYQPKLLLADGTTEVVSLSLDNPFLDVRIGITTMSVDTDSVTGVWWVPPIGAPYALSYANASVTLTVIGCSAIAYLLDLDTNNTVGVCITTCATREIAEAMEGAPCNGVGCCQTTLSSSVRSFGIHLARINRSRHLEEPSNIKAFVSNDQSYTFMKEDLFSVDTVNGDTSAPGILQWAIAGELSCEHAKINRTSYACLGNNSVCSDDITRGLGYYCACSAGYEGNPYIRDGCKVSTTSAVTSTSSRPEPNCTTTCGNITVPFPFGLVPGCYMNEYFHMECTSNLLRFHDATIGNFYVIEIQLDEGQVRMRTAEQSQNQTLKKEGIVSSSPYTFAAEWVIGNSSCNESKNGSSYACISRNNECQDVAITADRLGYRCKCASGYKGNAYISDGCEDINECEHPDRTCSGICINYAGGHACCPPGSQIDSEKKCIPQRVQGQTVMLGVATGVSSGISILIVIIVAVFLNKKLKQIKLQRTKERNFSQNHGLLLQKLISTNDVNADRTQIFSLEELEKATNNFDATRIVGQGGHGTVYKGILSDQRVVAIKKPKITVKRVTDQFINEVAILSQINHRNVVKLYGCCLETEVPLLVYEYITNGTLADHLHVHSSSLSWEARLRIASEIVGALAYLHSAASISIYHRDVKTSNVLLDDALIAKVSDFGASKPVPLDHTHLTTAIQGTHGYLDPEYYHTRHLTEKSDVYSFGVILVELLTGMKPVSSTVFGEKNLAMYFNWALKSNCALEFLEARVRAEGAKEQLGEVVLLAGECLRLRGAERPSMKEVEIRILALIRGKEKKQDRMSCDYSEETEHPFDGGCCHAEEHSDSNLTHRTREDATRCHSLEEEFMLSLNYPR
ncbi:wall-associated receptor kinase 3-like [Canna indica]|uniref:Wall-associated receptor kinase 3-like n=1 Tax=Canna indica TaxID=4628 RepID=A0AAQ3JR27_9LILI|nr:wall-associated receptor kinase 3-like [Canna indica]